jgi:signal transduction histidine kinase
MHTKLAEANRVATAAEMAASVVHEISQPLSALLMNAQAGIRYLSADPPNIRAAQAALDGILRCGRDVSETIKSIRALFKRSDPCRTPVELGSVIRDVLCLLGEAIRQRGIAVKVSIEDDLPSASGNKLQIQQVLINLISNAIESMEQNTYWSRELDITAHRVNDSITTAIADRGHGLSDHEKIFDAFFTTKKNGMGMGLRISKTIIEAHDGVLWACPRQERGTVFTFSLPISEKAA